MKPSHAALGVAVLVTLAIEWQAVQAGDYLLILTAVAVLLLCTAAGVIVLVELRLDRRWLDQRRSIPSQRTRPHVGSRLR
jgi:hypothetical protein